MRPLSSVLLALCFGVAGCAKINGATDDWSYTTIKNEMSDTPVRLACAYSSNRVRQPLPYKSQRLRLCVRADESSRKIFIQFPYSGQFYCLPSEGCVVGIRFGRSKAQYFNATPPGDGSDDTLILDEDYKIIDSLKTADRIVIEATIYRSGDQNLIFNVPHLKWVKTAREQKDDAAAATAAAGLAADAATAEATAAAANSDADAATAAAIAAIAANTASVSRP